MLEAINLTKIYKSKGSVRTKALDNVSVCFPETGMVFLLGKSGSGKSTLLNVCGGLDAPTAGEIIVNGRSSKDFTQSDFDSYRNTLVGFIFQEYNVLNEFSVENNIALALQLQGKPKNKKAIKQLLQDVDLVGYERRKPNTLSGGQKQRIAIARALVKEPKIIMADEPTGALDSNTGVLVFDTLKKLSKDKLVIVVSHDRDFAEKYADRIIELKDGQIISDVTKKQTQPQNVSENIQIIGDETMSIKNNKLLTEKDYEYIRSFLARSDSALIASNSQEIASYKKANRISEGGEKEYFEVTDEEQIVKGECDPKKQKFIRSKLPIRHAFKIGSSGLKSKPWRLVFTIFLCTIAFTMFGVISTMMLFNATDVLYKSLDDSGCKVVSVSKQYKYEGSDHPGNVFMDDSDVQKVVNAFGEESFGVKSAVNDGSFYKVNGEETQEVSNEGAYYQYNSIYYAAYLPKNHAFLKNRIKVGSYPQTDAEVMISSYTASVLIKSGSDNATKPEDLIGKKLKQRFSTFENYSQEMTFTISGIFDSGDDVLSTKYSKYKEAVKMPTAEAEQKQQQTELSNLYADVYDGYHLLAFFAKKDFNEMCLGYGNFCENANKDKPYCVVFAPYTSSLNAKKIISFKWSSDSTRFMITNQRVARVEEISNDVSGMFLKYFIIVGTVFAVFAMLLLSNYIVISISYKTKEIGILRAIGARGIDVLKIFYAESFIIACFSIFLSTIASIAICNYLNSMQTLSLLNGISLFVFGVPSFLIMSAIALLAALIATLLPVRSAAKKKPVEAIRSL